MKEPLSEKVGLKDHLIREGAWRAALQRKGGLEDHLVAKRGPGGTANGRNEHGR